MNHAASRDWVISWLNLEGVIGEGNAFRMSVDLPRSTWLCFDPSRQEFSVEIEMDSDVLPSVLPRAIDVRVGRTRHGASALILASSSSDLRRYFYDFIVEVLELIRDTGAKPPLAVDEAWHRWGELIEEQSVLSRERQVGLIGEIWLLRRLARSHSWRHAIDAWHRVASAEHDFCLEHVDVEVKSTTTDRRLHTIGSVEQLLPSPGRTLFLLSNQFASAPRLAAASFSLATVVDEVLADLGGQSELIEVFAQRLELVGWRAHHQRFYSNSFVWRSATRLIKVDETCPRLVPSMLERELGPLASRVASVMYSVDVSGLGFADGSKEFLEVIP